MRNKFLIHIGRALATLVILIPVFWCISYYYNYRAYTFWEAAKSFDIPKLEELIHKKGYSPDTKLPGLYPTAITFLSCANHEDTDKAYATMKYLLEQGADPDSKGKMGISNLNVAIFCIQPKLVELLVENGADVNSVLMHYGSAYIYAAIITKQYDLVQYLLDHGAYTTPELYKIFKRKQKEASLKKTK